MPAMTHEERAKWIVRILVLMLAGGVVAGAWVYQRKDKAQAVVKEEMEEAPKEIDLTIYHFHEPGNPDSEALADHYNELTRKYGQVLVVNRIDIVARPLDGARERVEKAPKTVMAARGQRVFEFDGLWPYFRIEAKVDEILRGLERMSDDWRPKVNGMTRVNG